MVAAVQDIEFGKISNRLIVTGLMIGIAVQMWKHSVFGIYFFLGNISVPVILFYLLFQMRVLGAGDIKLFSMIGSMVTTAELFQCMAYSFLAAGFGAVLFLAVDKRKWQRLQYAKTYLLELLKTGKIKPYRSPYEKERLSFAFSVPILFGTAMALLWMKT